jgi:hypothetical protein
VTLNFTIQPAAIPNRDMFIPDGVIKTEETPLPSVAAIEKRRFSKKMAQMNFIGVDYWKLSKYPFCC